MNSITFKGEDVGYCGESEASVSFIPDKLLEGYIDSLMIIRGNWWDKYDNH